MRVASIVLIAVLIAALPAAAQHEPAPAAIEQVTVTAPQVIPENVLRDFVTAHAAPAQPVGKLARWRIAFCPVVAGLPAAYGTVVLDRVMAVAAEAGAPIGKTGCKPNVDIVFSASPQALLDEVRRKHWELLGYHDTAQSEELAKVTHAVQAWYTTQRVDLDGNRTIDAAQRTKGVWLAAVPDGSCKACAFYLPDAREFRTQTSRLGDALRSELFHVIVTVDLKKIAGIQLGRLADDIAMQALAPTKAFDLCAPMVSITNLMADDCPVDRKADSLSEYDLAYLKSLYRMDLSASLADQTSAISFRMKQTLHAGPN
jgi:hypothetical protein